MWRRVRKIVIAGRRVVCKMKKIMQKKGKGQDSRMSRK